MNDPAFHRLLASLDELVERHGQVPAELATDLEHARLRLDCLSRRLGTPAQESAYLRFMRRLVDEQQPACCAVSA